MAGADKVMGSVVIVLGKKARKLIKISRQINAGKIDFLLHSMIAVQRAIYSLHSSSNSPGG